MLVTFDCLVIVFAALVESAVVGPFTQVVVLGGLAPIAYICENGEVR